MEGFFLTSYFQVYNQINVIPCRASWWHCVKRQSWDSLWLQLFKSLKSFWNCNFKVEYRPYVTLTIYSPLSALLYSDRSWRMSHLSIRRVPDTFHLCLIIFASAPPHCVWAPRSFSWNYLFTEDSVSEHDTPLFTAIKWMFRSALPRYAPIICCRCCIC